MTITFSREEYTLTLEKSRGKWEVQLTHKIKEDKQLSDGQIPLNYALMLVDMYLKNGVIIPKEVDRTQQEQWMHNNLQNYEFEEINPDQIGT